MAILHYIRNCPIPQFFRLCILAAGQLLKFITKVSLRKALICHLPFFYALFLRTLFPGLDGFFRGSLFAFIFSIFCRLFASMARYAQSFDQFGFTHKFVNCFARKPIRNFVSWINLIKSLPSSPHLHSQVLNIHIIQYFFLRAKLSPTPNIIVIEFQRQ